jgi:signal transduction histidine kinase
MLPLTVGCCLGNASLPNLAEGVVSSAVLGATYAVTTAYASREGGGRAATAMANALSYPGFFVVASLVTRFARKMADELEEARRLAVEQSARLAAETATNREHRMLHDSALQTLEAIAAGSAGDPAAVRGHAWREAAALRLALRLGAPQQGGLIDQLSRLCSQFASRGLRVELIADELSEEPQAEAASALCDAAREALTNVLKHAGVDRCVVRVADEDGTWRVTIRDHGCGFDPARVTRGFGLDNSIEMRLAEIGGWCRIDAAPGKGARVELGLPG